MKSFYAFVGSHGPGLILAISGVLVLLCTQGCQSRAAELAPQSNSVATKSPEDTLYEQVRSGTFQLQAATDSLEAALKEAKAQGASAKSADLKGALADVVACIDDAGGAVAEDLADLPPHDAFTKDLAAQKKRRQKAIDDINDALHDLRDAGGTLDSVTDGAPQSAQDQLTNLAKLIDVAMGDLRGALQALGGQEEVPLTE